MSWNRLHIRTHESGSLLHFSGNVVTAAGVVLQHLTDEKYGVLEAESPDSMLFVVKPSVKPETVQQIADLCFANDPPITVFTGE